MLTMRRGFSLVELMVVVALLAILLSLAAPAFNVWIANAKVRAANESLQSALRLAQAEAQRRFRQVVFFRTTDTSCTTATTAAATGTNWVVKSIAMDANDESEVVQCGQLTDAPASLTLVGPTALCFSSAGRLIAVTDPAIGGPACAINNTTGVSSIDVQGVTAGSRRLRVYANLAGNVRSCDIDKNQSSSPDGCPT